MDVFSLVMRLKEEGAAQVKASVDKLNGSFTDAKKGATGLDDVMGKLKTTLGGLAAGLTVGATLNKIVEETTIAQNATAQLNAALASTGRAATLSADALSEHASALQKVTTFGDDAIVSAQALLVTFKNISDASIPRATEAVVDLAAALQIDLKSAAAIVGKSLNMPDRAALSLRGAMIQLSDQQQATIQKFLEMNDIASAQGVIFDALDQKSKGAAAAMRNTLGGAIEGLKNDFGDLFEVSTDASAGIVNAINAISRSLGVFSGLLNDVVQFVSVAFVGAVKAINNIWLILQQLIVKSLDDFLSLFEVLRSIPGIGELAGKGLDRVRGALQGTMRSLQAEQASWVAWEEQQYRNIFVSQKLEQQAKKTAAAVTGGGAGGPKRETPSDVATRYGQRAATGGGATANTKFTVANIDSAAVREKIAPLKQMMSEAQAMFLRDMNEMAAQLDRALSVSLGEALAGGIERAVASGSIKEGLKSLLSAMLSGIGSILIQLGTALLPVGQLIAKLWSALASLNPIAMTAAAVGLIAVGGLMKGIAGRVVGGASSTSSGGGSSYSAPSIASGPMTMPTQFYGPTAAGAASTIEAVTPMNVTIIGPNDPSAQRQMQELMRNAQRRGNA